MGQIQYTYPAMLAHAGEMSGYLGAIRGMGEAIASEQGVLAGSWMGDTGETFQQWQSQWNTSLHQLEQAYQSMIDSHENNTNTMAARDMAEGSKWGG
jgi:WXG100 family type VII secretion target